MYDITFLMTCCSSETNESRYRKRLLFFKKYGLINIKNRKIKLILLANKDDNINDPIFSSWDYDIDVIQSHSNHCAPKTYSFFGNLKEEHINNTKWLMTIDDDSVTNIDLLIELLNKNLDYNSPVNILSGLSSSSFLVPEYIPLLKKYGIINYAGNRGIESFILSQSSLIKIKNNLIVKDFLKKVVDEIGDNGFSDAIMPFVARFVGSKTLKFDYMSFSPLWDKFERKSIAHIHCIFNINAFIKGKNSILTSIFWRNTSVDFRFFLAKILVLRCLKKWKK